MYRLHDSSSLSEAHVSKVDLCCVLVCVLWCGVFWCVYCGVCVLVYALW